MPRVMSDSISLWERAGLLDMLDRDEDKLAAVLGHEAAHVVARHSAEGVGLRVLLAGVAWVFCRTASYLFADARVRSLCVLTRQTQLLRLLRP